MPLEEFIKKIKSLEIQGAKEIAIESLKFLKAFTKEKGFGKEFDKACEKLEAARPTAVVLHNCLETLKKNRSRETIAKLIAQLNKASKQIGTKGSTLVRSEYTIMTHCHSGEALAVIRQAWHDKKKISVIATETEPKHQGIKTVKELAALGIPVTLIEDSAIGYFMHEVDMVVVGADAIRTKEGLINKTGTYLMALAAYQNKKPFYVAADTLKLDRRVKFAIEERPVKEIYVDIHEKLKGVKIRNPAFDITSWKFISRIITEKGVMTPANILRLLKSD